MIIDFRLKVFQTAARQLSFTAAAEELYISQPAVTKHINELEKNIQKPLFNRHGRKLSLTKAGKLLLSYTNKILTLYEQLDDDIKEMNQAISGQVRIGASTTLAQYILPAILAQFKSTHPQTNLHLLNANTRTIESYVLEQKIDLGIIEGEAANPLLHYEPFVRDEIVLVTRMDNKYIKKETLTTKDLLKLPLVLREKGSGTLAVLLNALKTKGISEKDLQVEMELGSSESVKHYLMHSRAYAFISIHTIIPELTERKLKVVELEDLDIGRTLQFVTLHGQHSNLLSHFKKFCLSHYNHSE